METFIWVNGRAEGKGGYNDDLVMSLATACYVRDTALKFAQQGIDITNAALKNWHKTTPIITPGQTSKKQAGWTMNVGDDKQEDLTWLL
jgi:hypothetical protein